MTGPYASSMEHLRDELARVDCLVRAQLLRFERAHPEAQRERYWHLTDEYLESLAHDDEHPPLALFDPPAEVRQLLARADEHRAAIDARVQASAGRGLRLRRLLDQFGLDDREQDALLIALLPSLHSTHRHRFGVLQHDPARTTASVGLLVEMLARNGDELATLLAMLGSSGKLATARLIALSGADDEPIALRSVTVDDRVLTHLLGSDPLDARLVGIAHWYDAPVSLPSLPLLPETMHRLEALPDLRVEALWQRLRIKFSGPDPELAVQSCAAVARASQRRLLVIDVASALAAPVAWPLVIDLALREARLADGLPMFKGAGSFDDAPEHRGAREQLICKLATFPLPAVIEVGGHHTASWPGRGVWMSFHLDAPTLDMREHLWEPLIASAPGLAADAHALTRTLASSFRFTASQIDHAWRAARSISRRRDIFSDAVGPDDLFSACRQQSAHELVAFAQRIEPRRDLKLENDIVLPAASMRVLTELRGRIRNHRRVQGAMGLGAHMRLARGVTAMFVGGSGTGKTMAAEVLASEQHIDLYRIDLGSLVSKWVGETEKNLSRIFAEAERANCMLFFDEADAMFGHRGEVKGGQDRWANLQVNHLLQCIEDYSGTVVLATNLCQNMDEAFKRRIHMVAEFPAPNAPSRLAIWDRLLPGNGKRAVTADDLQEIAHRFELTGGNIRNVVLDACYRALDGNGTTVTTRHIAASTAREYQKSGRPVMQAEFGRFYDWAIQDVIAPAQVASSV